VKHLIEDIRYNAAGKLFAAGASNVTQLWYLEETAKQQFGET
jgi:hypothetical protein